MPVPKPQAPTKTQEKDRTVVEHPAFGCVQVFRQTGDQYCFNSDTKHNTVICMQVHQAELHRHLNTNWVHQCGMIAEFHFSELQWAQMVSSLNGTTIPCTIKHSARYEGFVVPDIIPESVVDVFKTEVDDTLSKVTTDGAQLIKNLRALAAQKSIGKTALNELVNDLDRLVGHMPSTFDFIRKQFEKTLSKSVASAKMDLEAYTNSKLHELGLQATNQPSSLLIESKAETTVVLDETKT